MKNYFILLIIVFSFSNSEVFAQNFFFGLKNGINLSSISETGPIQDLQVKKKDYVGFNTSTWLAFKVGDKTRLSIEPGYLVKGAAFEGSSDVIKLQYIDLPLLFEYKITDNLNVMAGPNISYLINAKMKVNGQDSDAGALYNESSEISGIFGVSYDLSFFMDIGVRYNMGFTKISETILTNDIGEKTGTIREFNRYLQFLIRFKIAN